MREGAHIKLLWVKTLHVIRMSGKLGRLGEEGVMDVSVDKAACALLRAELWKERGTGEGENGRG